MTNAAGIAGPLDWLHPVVDRCRALIAERSQPQRWTKRSLDGRRDELVTDLDLTVESLLIEAIREHHPLAAIVSEESNPDPAALAAETCFVIDPIDGTDQLVTGQAGFAISIAAFHNGQPVAALLDMPAHSRRFDGVAGRRPLLNGRPVVLSQVDSLRQARLAVSATQHRNPSLEVFWRTLKAGAVVPTPAFAAKFAAVLSRDSDAALYLPTDPHPAAIWDYAAPAFLLALAGGWFGALDGASLLDQRPYSYTGGWIATPLALRDQLLAAAGGRS